MFYDLKIFYDFRHKYHRLTRNCVPSHFNKSINIKIPTRIENVIVIIYTINQSKSAHIYSLSSLVLLVPPHKNLIQVWTDDLI